MTTKAGAGVRSLKWQVGRANLVRLFRRPRLALVGALALVIALAGPAAAPPGDLDPTFDGDGKVTTDFAGDRDAAPGIAIQEDGKIVAVGNARVSGANDFAVARYNTDGSLDTTFDVDGKVTTDFGGGDSASAVAIQEDGKIVAVGYAAVGGTNSSDFAVARYNTDGSLDTTFDVDGKVTTNFAGLDDQANAVILQVDGKIVAAGCLHCEFASGDFALARYNTNGSLDSTFGGDGKVTTDFNGGQDVANGVAIQRDGKIVAVGSAALGEFISGYDFGLARYNTDGLPDLTFGVVGKVTTNFAGFPDQAFAVAIQGVDEKIVAAGRAGVSGTWDFALARYDALGSLDSTFDSDGKVTTHFGGDDGAFAVAIQGDGKIVAAGYARVPEYDFALARYNADGSLDATFGGDGKVTTDVAGDTDLAFGMAIQADGRIVAGGYALVSGVYDFAVARYRGDVEAELSITKTGPSGRVPTGRNMTYTITVTNNGPDAASDVVVTDTLPPSVAFVDAGFGDPLPVGYCDPPSGGVVTCYLGTIASGGSRSVIITVKPTQAGMITNSASVTSATPDYNLANNSDSVDTAICRITSRRSSIPCG